MEIVNEMEINNQLVEINDTPVQVREKFTEYFSSPVGSLPWQQEYIQ